MILVAFMGLIIELKNSFEILQVSNLNDFAREYKQNDFGAIIVDSSNQKIEDIRKLVKLINKKIIIVYKDEISDDIKNSVSLCISKPINKELILEKLTN